jgi:hypothetical protein
MGKFKVGDRVEVTCLSNYYIKWHDIPGTVIDTVGKGLTYPLITVKFDSNPHAAGSGWEEDVRVWHFFKPYDLKKHSEKLYTVIKKFSSKLDGRVLRQSKQDNKPDKIVIYANGLEVIAKDVITGKTAKAKCSFDDTFDFYVGAQIALLRLLKGVK